MRAHSHSGWFRESISSNIENENEWKIIQETLFGIPAVAYYNNLQYYDLDSRPAPNSLAPLPARSAFPLKKPGKSFVTLVLLVPNSAFSFLANQLAR